MTVLRAALTAGLVGLAVAAAPVAVAEPAPDPNVKDIRDYPLAQGRYSTPHDFYFVFFKTPDGRFCGIGPNGGPVGCDAVPDDAPPGVNQTVVNSWAPAQYRHSEDATFTRDVDVLPVGHRLENWGATCAVEADSVVRCDTYNSHGFALAPRYGELW